MTIKASGRAVSILAAGLVLCFAGPSPAAANADDNATSGGTSAGFVPPEPVSSEPASPESNSAAGEPVPVKKQVISGSQQHRKMDAHHKSGRLALKSLGKAQAGDVDDGGTSTPIPPRVSNANAQMRYADAPVDTPAGDSRAMSAWANRILQSGSNDPADAGLAAQVVSPDELNDIDRTLPPSAPPAPRMAMAAADAPVEPATASNDESSPWDKASLVGKIFMAFGGLLTLASAIRMFLA
jgi:hypothetical protein